MIRLDQVTWDLALDIDPNATGPGQLAAFDFSSHPDADNVLVGMAPDNPARMTAWQACARQKLLNRSMLRVYQLFGDLAASHRRPTPASALLVNVLSAGPQRQSVSDRPNVSVGQVRCHRHKTQFIALCVGASQNGRERSVAPPRSG